MVIGILMVIMGRSFAYNNTRFGLSNNNCGTNTTLPCLTNSGEQENCYIENLNETAYNTNINGNLQDSISQSNHLNPYSYVNPNNFSYNCNTYTCPYGNIVNGNNVSHHALYVGK